jgi:hypothetical protein
MDRGSMSIDRAAERGGRRKVRREIDVSLARFGEEAGGEKRRNPEKKQETTKSK